MRLEIRTEADYTFTKTVTDNSETSGNLQPDTATYVIYDNSGSTIQSGSATIEATATLRNVGEMSFTFTAANNITTGCNFKYVLTYVTGTVTDELAILFDVVKHPIEVNIDDSELFVYLPELRDNLITETGNATALDVDPTIGFIDENLIADRRKWTGSLITFYFTDGSTHKAYVTTSEWTTGIIQFCPLYTDGIAIGNKYEIAEGYQGRIDTAFDEVRTAIRNKVGLLAGYIDQTVVDKLTIFKTIETVCIGAVEVTDDKWDFRQKKFREMYDMALTTLSEAYDQDQDGDISDTESDNKPNFTRIDLCDEWGRA